jgi:hypothetical protein
MRISKSMALAAWLLAFLPGDAAAQPLAGMIKHLFDVGTINAQDVNGVPHSSHFFLGGENLTLTTRQLNIALAAQLASFPLASSSGGFTYGLNDRGEVVPTSTNFGPSFAERGVTIGRRKFNFGFTFQATSYDSFEGLDLASGDLRFIREHNNCCPPANNDPDSPTDFAPEFERDLLSSRLRASIDTKTTAFFANYGLTDRLDVGLAVPIVKVEIDATVDGEILRTATGTNTIHSFDTQGSRTASVSAQDSASGLGDILLRAKYNLYRTSAAAFAAALDLRLPTGDKDNILGTGATQAQIFFIASGEYGFFSPHVNLGYTFSHGETSAEAASLEPADSAQLALPASVTSNPVEALDLSVPDEINYTVGFNVGAGPRVTFGFDMRGRTIRDVPRFALQNNTYINRGPGALPSASFTADGEFSVESENGNLNTLLGVVGGKVNLWNTFILNVTVLFPMTDPGLKPKPTPVIGFDYVF